MSLLECKVLAGKCLYTGNYNTASGRQRLMTEMFAAFCLPSSYSDNERCPWQPTSEAGSVKGLDGDDGDRGGRQADGVRRLLWRRPVGLQQSHSPLV